MEYVLQRVYCCVVRRTELRGIYFSQGLLWRSPKDEAVWNIFFAQVLLLRSPKDGAAWDIFCTGLIVA